jgi:hypothetical protein
MFLAIQRSITFAGSGPVKRFDGRSSLSPASTGASS